MKNEVMEAVRQLRQRLGDTQQSFAARTGLAISTVVRYELSRAPRGKALVMFEQLAAANRHRDLQAIFQRASLRDGGIEPIGLPKGSTLQIPEDHEAALLAFIEVLRQPRYASVRSKVLRLMKEPIDTYQTAFRAFKEDLK